MQSSPSQGITQVFIYVIVAALLVYRLSRPQRLTTTRLFVMPILLLAMTAFAIWGNAMAAAQLGRAPAPPLGIVLALVVGALAGIPLGILRGKHSEVRPTGRPGVMFVHSSPLIIIVWVAVFALRALLRYLLPNAGPSAGMIGDGLLAFAVAALITSYVVIYQRYQALAQQPPAAQTPPVS